MVSGSGSGPERVALNPFMKRLVPTVGLLSHQDRLPVAQSARALCSVGHGLSLLPTLEAQWVVGSDSHASAGTRALVEGRKRHPSAAIIDSQSVKSTECSDERGYDAGKKINGRKRHILVDTIGLLLVVMVLPANIQDRDGAKQLLAAFFAQAPRRRVKHIWADGGYAGALLEWARKLWRCTVEIVKRTELHTFKVLPRRWVVERTFGWLGRYRRLNRDYERQAKTGETMVYLAMIRLMLARLGRL